MNVTKIRKSFRSNSINFYCLTSFHSSYHEGRTVGGPGQNQSTLETARISVGTFGKVRLDCYDAAHAEEKHYQGSTLHGVARSFESRSPTIPFRPWKPTIRLDVLFVDF